MDARSRERGCLLRATHRTRVYEGFPWGYDMLEKPPACPPRSSVLAVCASRIVRTSSIGPLLLLLLLLADSSSLNPCTEATLRITACIEPSSLLLDVTDSPRSAPPDPTASGLLLLSNRRPKFPHIDGVEDGCMDGAQERRRTRTNEANGSITQCKPFKTPETPSPLLRNCASLPVRGVKMHGRNFERNRQNQERILYRSVRDAQV